MVNELLASILINLIPGNFEQFLWWGIGGSFARAFGKKLDYEIQRGPRFEELPLWQQCIVKRMLDFMHHWWVGGLFMQYGIYGVDPTISYWFGAGVLVDDLPDLYKRISYMIKTIAKYLGK